MSVRRRVLRWLAGTAALLALAQSSRAALTSSMVTANGTNIISFTAGSGTWTVPPGVTNVQVLVVGGGGAGGGYLTTSYGGGGGAGGLIYYGPEANSLGASYAVTPGSNMTVVVGAGGAISGNTSPYTGGSGANSSFGALVALGGGGGGGNGNGVNGGSGGGSSGTASNVGGSALQPGSSSGGFGNAGASGFYAGGGGAGVAGSGKQGGNGLPYSISGTTTYYAGGGNGAGDSNAGGLGGGGSSLNGSVSGSGTPNTGGGGGANWSKGAGAGGSGIVIVQYVLPAVYWDGTGTGWDAVSAWSTTNTAATPDPAAVPGANNVASFNITGVNTPQTVNLNGAQSAGGLAFNSTGAVTLQGGSGNQTLNLGPAGIAVNSGAGAVTVGSASPGQNVAISLQAAETWTSDGSGVLTVNNGVSIGAGGNQTLTLGGANPGANTVAGSIANGAATLSLAKAGAGTWSLTGANTYSGGTTLTAGQLNLNNGGSSSANSAIGTGALILGGGTLDNTSGADVTLLPNNPQAWNGDFTYAGSANSLNLGTGAVTLGANRTVTVANNTLTVGGIISGSSLGLTKAGAGKLVLSGANTYTGATTVSGGELDLSNWGTTTLGAITVSSPNGAVLGLAGTATYNLGAKSLAVGSGTGGEVGIVNQTGGTVTNTSGTVLVGNGTGSTGTYNLSGGTVSSFASSTRGVMLGVNGGNTATFNLSGTGNLALGSAELAVGRDDGASPSCTVAYNQNGGTANVKYLSIGGQSGSTGTTASFNITNGVFTAANFQNLVAAASSSAMLYLGGGAQVTLPALPVPAGPVTLTFDFTDGWLAPYAASTTYLSGLSHAYLTAQGVNFNVGNAKDITVGQLLEDAPSQAGTLTKTGAGTLTLTVPNTYSGGTTIRAGKLVIDSTQTASGALTVGANASLAINVSGASQWQPASLTLANPCTLEFNNVQNSGTTPAPLAPLAAIGTVAGVEVNVNSLADTATIGSRYPLLGNAGSATGYTLNTQPVGTLGHLDVSGATLVYVVDGFPDLWTGADGTNPTWWDIGTSLNWGLNAANNTPANTYAQNDYVLFDDSSSLTTVSIQAPVTPSGVAFNNNYSTYTVTGGGLNVIGGGTGLKLNGTGTVVLAGGAHVYTGATLINAGTLQLGDGTSGNDATLAGTSGVTDNGALVFNRFGSSSASYVISGSGTVTVTGSGTQTLTGANTYSGGTTLSYGQLNLNNGGSSPANSAIGVGPLTILGGTVDNTSGGDVALQPNNPQNWNGNFTYAGSANNLNLGAGPVTLNAPVQVTVSANTLTVGGAIGGGAYSLTKAGSGTLALSGASTYGGGTTVSAGTLVVSGGDNRLPTATPVTLGDGGVESGKLQLGDAGGARNQTVTGLSTSGMGETNAVVGGNSGVSTLTLNIASGTSTYGGLLGGAGANENNLALTKSGSGTLSLTNLNTYSGGTMITAGVLSVDNSTANSLGSGAVTVASPGQFKVTGATGVVPNTLNIAGAAANNMASTMGALFYNCNGGNLSLSGTVNLTTNATICSFSAASTATFNNPILGTGVLTFYAGGAAQSHNQTWVLKGGPSTYNGNTTIYGAFGANAIVQLNGGALPSTTVLTLRDSNMSSDHNDAVFDLNGYNQTLAGLTDTAASGGSGRFVVNSSTALATLTVSNTNNYTFGGVIGLNPTTANGQAAGSGNIGLVKQGAGILTLSGVNTYTGATLVNNGTLKLSGASANNLAASPTISVGGGATLDVTGLTSGTLALAAGQILQANGTVTGSVTVNTSATLGGNGAISGNVIVADGGNVAPGASVGTLTISGNLDVGAMAAGTTGKLYYELGPTNGSDSLAVSGTLAIGSGVLGVSNFVFTNVAGLQAGTYTLITSGGISGSLNPADLTQTIGAFTCNLQINGNNLQLVVWSGTLTPPVLSSYGPRSGSSFPLTFSGPSGQSYRVLSSTNVALPLTAWTVLTSGTFGASPVTYTDTGATNTQQFYRITSP